MACGTFSDLNYVSRMTRALSWIPTPQVTEQDDHDDQSDHVGQNSRGA